MLTEEQSRIVNALDKHVLVSAGAGSGKTKVLVDRYVQTLLENPELTPGNIVAVTYTKRAASEMRNRIKAAFDERIISAHDPHIREKLLGFRLQVDSALIGTIHSLCDSILHTFPEEAKVDPAFDVLDTLDSLELIRESAEQALLELSNTDQAVQQLLSAYDTNHVISWVVKTVQQRTEFDAACRSLPGLSTDALRSHAEQLAHTAQKICCERLSKHAQFKSYLDFAAGFDPATVRNEKLRLALNTVLRARERLNSEAPAAEVFSLVKEITRLKFSAVGKTGNDTELQPQIKELRDWLSQFTAGIPDQLTALDEEAFALIPAFVASYNRALEIYREKKSEQKVLDYHDQIEATHELLKNPRSRARQHFNERLAAVLVDEFQDTNTLQSEIIGYLAGAKARVLLIGDEKQSIYRFQGADLSVFSLWSSWFADGNGSFPFNWEGERVLKTLSQSFRGHPGVTIFINNVFHRVLNGQGLLPRYHARYRELVAAREGNIEARSHVVHYSGDHNGGKFTGQAEAVAKWIKDMVESANGSDSCRRYGDFAVLLPQHSSFQQFEEAFSLLGLPYASMGGKSFLSTQEVFDLENLLSFINCSLDDQALFGILRSPLFGISDDVLQLLFNFKLESQAASLWQALCKFSTVQTSPDERLSRATEILNALLKAAQTVSLPELLRRAAELTGYDVTVLALPSGKRRNRNVWKFISMANEQESLTIAQFLHRLETARSAGVEERAAPLDAGDSIKLMTIHSAKGLEFPVVVLACMDAPVNPARGGPDARLIFHPEYGIAFNAGQEKSKPAYFELCRLFQNDLEAAEKRRLFYVAASRARDYLAVFLEDKFIGEDCPQAWLLQEALTAHEVPLPGAAVQQCELEGAFGVAPYLTCFHTPIEDDTLAASKVGGLADEHADALMGRLNTAVKANPRLLEPFAVEQGKERPAPEYWLRVTASSPEYVNHELVLGSYFHSVMEYFAATKKNPDSYVLESLARYLNGRATDADLQAVLVHEAEKLLPVFYSSELYDLMMNARRLLYERTYIAFKDDEHSKSRRPDLLLQDAAGDWRIVDYKTDVVAPDTLERELSRHRQQVMTYAEDIKTICNIDAPGYLYFARTGQLCALFA